MSFIYIYISTGGVLVESEVQIPGSDASGGVRFPVVVVMWGGQRLENKLMI